jgi:hypothetical protein
MAARLNRRHQETIREKIRASQLVNRLENHILDDLELSATQVTAALGLLKKCVPDLKASDDTLTVDGEIGVRQVVKEYVDSSE